MLVLNDYIPTESNEFRYPDERKRKPPVPKHDEKPLMGLSTKKDFILENAVESINAIPKCPKRIYVDTRKGDKQFLDPSGLQPIFLNKKVKNWNTFHIHIILLLNLKCWIKLKIVN